MTCAALVLLRPEMREHSAPSLPIPPALYEVPRELSTRARMEDPRSSKTHVCSDTEP